MDFIESADEGKSTSLRILEAATTILSEEGMEAVSMRKIGRAVGVSQAAIYRHYKDKEALISAVVSSGYTGIVSALETASALSQNLDDFFRRALEAYVNLALSDPGVFKAIALREAGPVAGQVNSLSPGVSAKRKTFQILVGKLEEGMEAGTIEKTDPEIMAQAMWMSVFGIAARLVLEPEVSAEHRQRLIEAAATMISRGLKPAGAYDESRLAAKEKEGL